MTDENTSDQVNEPDLDLANARLKSRVEELESLLGSSTDHRVRRILELEGQLRFANERIEALETKGEELRLENERLKNDLEGVVAERVEQKLLPARQEVEQQLAAAQAEAEQFAMALATKEQEAAALLKVVDKLEVQRDEFDDMLRKEENKRLQAETNAKQALAQAARYRLNYLRTNDPTKGESGSSHQIKSRVLAWLGNWAARAELGIADDICPLCAASPACLVNPSRPNVHGSMLPKDVVQYLRTMVDEAVNTNKNAVAVLEAWATGGNLLDEAPATTAERGAGE